jgi:hypothetical protein
MANASEKGPEQVQLLILARVDPARYYVLSVEPTLFGDTALVRE